MSNNSKHLEPEGLVDLISQKKDDDETDTKEETTRTIREGMSRSAVSRHDSLETEKEIHIAPMLDYSKREFRKLYSILSTKLVLWTDMVVDDTIEHSDHLVDILECDILGVPNKQICQIGGNSPSLCGKATNYILEHYSKSPIRDENGTVTCGGGYQEINLNVDCPSHRVSGEREFGAVLMKKAQLTYKILEAMKENSSVPFSPFDKNDDAIPISIKCRIGVDEWDKIEFVIQFIETLRPVCKRFILHARKCILDGIMTARQNRSVPPLNFPMIYRICHEFPDCLFWINGGIKTLEHARNIVHTKINGVDDCQQPNLEEQNRSCSHHCVPCSICDFSNGSCIATPEETSRGNIPPNLIGVMLGRSAIDDPSMFATVDTYFHGLDQNPCQNRQQVLQKYIDYLKELYPKRCCDEHDDTMTHKLPVPKLTLHLPDTHCCICSSFDAWIESRQNGELYPKQKQMLKDKMPRPPSKMASRIVGRALKPIRGLFYGLPKSKIFIKTLDQLGKDTYVRNCGPGFILQCATSVMPDNLLDQDFVEPIEQKFLENMISV